MCIRDSADVVQTISQMDYIFTPIIADRVVMESSIKFATVINEQMISCLLYTSEEVRFQENRLGVNARLLEHGEETVVFLLAETYGVSEHRRIEFGISPGPVSFLFHINFGFCGLAA